MHLFRRQGRAAPAGSQCVQLTTAVPERRSMSLSSSSSEETPAQDGESSQPGPSSIPPLEDGLFPHIIQPPKPRIKHKETNCGVCGEDIIVAEIPRFPPSYAAPTSSDPDPDPTAPKLTGITLQCGDHTYCFSCLSTYINTNLENASVKTVFPIECPECDWHIQDYEAEKVLTKEELEGVWYWAKVFGEVPTFYCPIGTCSARIELPPRECSRDLRRTDCPACKESFCFRCQVKWHEGQTCAKYARTSGALTADKALQKLAKKQKWRRCSRCRIVVERNFGCRHMTCRCGFQFCYSCGRQWGSGCGQLRSKLCFPLKPELWPETRSWVVEMIRDLFVRSGSEGR